MKELNSKAYLRRSLTQFFYVQIYVTWTEDYERGAQFKIFQDLQKPVKFRLLARGTQLGGLDFYPVYASRRAMPANQGEINRENMAARGEYFRNYH